MKTDPNEKENMLWAFIHDAIAHPLMALTGYTSHRAWPRTNKVTYNFYTRVYALTYRFCNPSKMGFAAQALRLLPKVL